MNANLNSRDLQAFVAFCAELGAHDDPATFAETASHALTRLIACDRVIHVEYPSLWAHPRHVNTRPRPSDAEHFAYAAGHSQEYPLAPVWEAESRPTAVYRLSDHITARAWHRTEFYRLGRPTNAYVLVQTYRLGPGGMGSFALERSTRDFTDREMALLVLGYSAYRAMAEKVRMKLAERERGNSLAAHLRAVEEASVQADLYGRVVSATAAARRLLRQLGGKILLPPGLAGWWQACLVQSSGETPSAHREPGPGTSWVRAVCVRPATATQSGLIRLVEQPDTGEECARLRAAFGLSHREAECLHGLQRGRTNSELAKELDLGLRTVENYVARLYLKLGVATRLAAARKADAAVAAG